MSDADASDACSSSLQSHKFQNNLPFAGNVLSVHQDGKFMSTTIISVRG